MKKQDSMVGRTQTLELDLSSLKAIYLHVNILFTSLWVWISHSFSKHQFAHLYWV